VQVAHDGSQTMAACPLEAEVETPLEFETTTLTPVVVVAVVTDEVVVKLEFEADPVTTVCKFPDDQVQLFG
jgi:hypothetical protein